MMIRFIDESQFLADLSAMKDFNAEKSIVGIADDEIVIAESINDVIKKDFEELVAAFPLSVFYELRENHESYLESICGEHCIKNSFQDNLMKKQSPVRRRLF